MTTESGLWPSELYRGFEIQRRVLRAVVIRQLMTKYGRSNIGFLWIVLEPIILASGVLVLRSFISGSEENGVPMLGLLWTGYLPLTLWRHLSGSGVFALRRSGSMLYHREISLFDCCFATYIIELGGCTLAGLIVYWVMYTLGLIPPVNDISILLCGWLMMSLLASGTMMAFAVLTEYYEAAERFIQPFQYLMIPICGFLYMIDWLPAPIQKLAWYIPTVHCYEMVRDGLFGPTVPTHYSPWYPVLVSIITFAVVLPMVDGARNKIHFG